MKFDGLKSMAIVAMAAAPVLAPRAALACAMCGLSPGDHAGHAFNTSVLFMLSGPYVTFGLIGGIVLIAWRRANRRSLVVKASTPPKR
ncbi:MAG TPA: hypothetical protein VIX59_12145 [Candidatus Binataceae bacterium]|jgi:hypothetical protein